MAGGRIPFLNGITWDHPLVQHAQQLVIEKAVDKVLPRPSAPPPNLVALDRISGLLESMQQQQERQNTEEGPKVTPQVTHEVPKNTVSQYLAQIGAFDVDTGCLPCGRAHLGGSQAGLERAIELAQERGWDDPEVIARVATVKEELDALLEYDWTPERIAKSPPEHRAALERYVPEVKALRDKLDPGGPTSTLNQVSKDLKEALRFAREDGVDHPEAKMRVARAEASIDDLERFQLAPERVDKMMPDEAKWWEENLRPIRRLRQQLHNDTKTPDKLHDVAAGFGRLSTEAYRPFVNRQHGDLKTLAEFTADLRNRFKADTDKL